MVVGLPSGGHGPRTKQQFVYQTLRDAILRCTLTPGQRITTEETARQLAVSPIPVREALHQLQAEGLVVTIPHTGTVVAPISRDAVVEVFSVLEGLEVVASRIAAERLTDVGTQTLTTLLAQMDEAIRDLRYDDWSDLNSRFHLGIARITGMPMLQEMTARALDHWDRVRRFYFVGVLRPRAEQSQQEHHSLVRLMRDHDGPGLEQVVKIHNRGALAAYMEYIAAHPKEDQGVDPRAETA